MNILYDRLVENSLRFPQRDAVVTEQERVSYQELLAETDRLSGELSRLGVGEGSIVSILLRNSIFMVECFFAVWKLGAIAAPINFRETDSGVSSLLSISKSNFTISDGERCERLSALGTGSRNLYKEHLCAAVAAGKSQTVPAANISENADALYIFSSGTTGEPKIAVHTARALMEFTNRCYEFGRLYYDDDVFLSYSPLCHVGGIRIMLGNLVCGATLVLAGSFDPNTVLSLISREKVTQMFVIPPSLIMRLRDIAGEKKNGLDSLRQIRVSGGLCTAEAADLMFDFFGEITLVNGYGSSESAVSLFNVFSREEYLADRKRITSVGRPLPGCSVVLRRGDGSVISEQDTVGEAYGKCDYMFDRYINRKGTVSHGEWFGTGDLFSIDAHGNYSFAGRTKDIIKTGGENVFAGEVEAVVAQHPAIAECAVFGLPHDTLGEAVAAAIVLKPGQFCTGIDIVDYSRAHMASYKKPIRIFFVDELPKTTSGKVRKYELQKLAAEGKL